MIILINCVYHNKFSIIAVSVVVISIPMLSSDVKKENKYLFFFQVFNDLDHQVRISNTDQLEVGTCLGEGNFGKVFEGCLFKKVILFHYL